MANNKKIIDRGMIEEFGAPVPDSNVRRVCYTLSDAIDDVAMEISQKNPLLSVQKVELLLGGDFFTNTSIQMSELDFFLAVRSAQIEINSIGPMEKKLHIWWNTLKTAWQNRNKNTARFRKKQQKKVKQSKKIITQKDLIEKKEKPYTINSLKADFFAGLTERMTNLTVLYNQPNKIRILARDEYGFRINIYPALKHDDGLKVYNPNTHKFVLTQPQEAKSLLEQKNLEINKLNQNNATDQCNDIFYSVIRIFKNIFYNLRQSYAYSFWESIVYSCPTTLFQMDETSEHPVYDSFIKVFNYLNNCNLSKIRSIYNQENTIYQQNGINLYGIKLFLRDLNEILG